MNTLKRFNAFAPIFNSRAVFNPTFWMFDGMRRSFLSGRSKTLDRGTTRRLSQRTLHSGHDSALSMIKHSPLNVDGPAMFGFDRVCATWVARSCPEFTS
jgi:hypothetical protein